MSEVETKTAMGCGDCWRDYGVFEPVIACVSVEEDVKTWFWWCRVCERQKGWGMDGGTLDLGFVRDLKSDRANDFEVFGDDRPVGVFRPTA